MAESALSVWLARWSWLALVREREPKEAVGSTMLATDSGETRMDALQPHQTRKAQVFMRMWLGFTTARVMVALALIMMPWFLAQLKAIAMPDLSSVSVGYLLVVLVQRWQVGALPQVRLTPHLLGACIVADMLAIVWLNNAQIRVVNYYPLLAFPLLYVSLLGTRMQALGTGAALALVLLLDVWASAPTPDVDRSALFLQAALKGAGALAMAALIHTLALRLDLEIRRAQANRLAARTQIKVNELVLSEMTVGVLVVDETGRVRTANPAGFEMLGLVKGQSAWSLQQEMVWLPILEFVNASFVDNKAQCETVDLQLPKLGARSLRLSSRLTDSPNIDGQDRVLCVVLMEDMHEVQARIRQEKMAAMGRMSAAVAHEIRNPLAAIVQANALMQEDAQTPGLRKMTGIVAQNAQRIAQTVEDVLDVSRFPKHGHNPHMSVTLQTEVAQICQEWATMHGMGDALQLVLASGSWRVRFDAEHLRRVLTNLLDNAKRHLGSQSPPVVVRVAQVSCGDEQRAALQVWNAGQAMDASIERHLFEPFFSSQTRSSGLGLYICKQLCELHQAHIGFDRVPMPGSPARDELIMGNQFCMDFQWASSGAMAERTNQTLANG